MAGVWSHRQQRPRGFPGALGAAAALAALACGSPEPVSETGSEEPAVGEIAGRRISAAELDRPLRIALHDLERDRYELRVARLQGLLSEDIDTGRVDAGHSDGLARAIERGDASIWLEPPAPPRLDLELVGRPLYGEIDAPVTVTVFCDFDVPACGALQPSLRTLVAEFPRRVRIVHRDLAEEPHRDSASVAAAVGCADEQGEIQRFVRGVTTPPIRRGRAGLVRIARELRLDDEAFTACLELGRQTAWTDESDTMARHLGIRVVPTAFVNGLYVRGADLEEVRRLVGIELASMGEQPEPELLIAREAGLTLLGMVRNAREYRSLATIRIAREQRARSFRPGETIVDGVVLDAVREHGVELRKGERIEFLPVVPSAPARTLSRNQGRPRPEVRIEVGGPSIDDFRIVERIEVDEALSDREDLESMLDVGDFDAAGRGLLRVSEVPRGSLLERVGLQRGDVLVEVDGTPIYAEDNPLWDVFATGSRVHLIVRRGGAPWKTRIEVE
jgi:predicted DsbA family dithiol-disulfide isomerase